MKKINSNLIIFLLIGVIIGLLTLFIIVLMFNNDSSSNVKNDELNNIISEEYSKKEGNVIEEKKDDVNPLEYFEKINSSEDKNSLKQGFIKIVDFLFYDEEINGKKFSDLTDSVKIKILSLALSIDSKIDYYFPDYKETVSSGTKKIHSDIKIKIVALYIKITSKICSENEDLCASAKSNFESLKESFGISFDFLKNIGNEGLNKLKDWYVEYSEE